ncbi:MAG: DUF3015 family protein [Nitrospiraceae bacterium]
MKKYMFAMAIVLSQAVGAYAAMVETGPGCGLGAQIWADSAAKKHILQQAMIATTNGTGMQTFAITSGTSGCTNDGVIVQNEKVNVFAGINFENLSQEMAQGQGEHLTSLATLMGVPAEHQTEFLSLAQDQYMTLLREKEATSVSMVNGLYQAMAAHPVLAKVSTTR